jgi:outer membrane protein assembly factor BamA
MNEKILNWCENNGYPFASIRYDQFVFDNENVSASVILNTERLITIDSVIVMGEPKLSTVYISNYIGVKPGDVYNESVIRKIPGRIKELPMVTETRAFNIAFTENTARVILYLQDKKASQIDGVVGVLPDNNNTGKVQLTGDLRLRLLSSFGRGELFDLNWKQPRSKTQDLKVNLNYPFILNTPFGIDLKLAIYKSDTSYLETTLGAGLQFLLRQGSFLKLFVEDKNSSLLSTKQYENATVLPPFADVRKTMYGAALKFINVDYRLNPSKGYIIDFSAGAGNRNISKNGKINPEVYDSLELKSLQYNGEISADMYIRVLPKFILNPGVKTGGLGGNSTFDNELYRLGGLNSLRGFDEESINASLFAIGKVEIRYVLEQNSFLQLFFNGAWYERNSNSGYVSDKPIGFGAGITFDTRLGIFSFNYALGREFSNPVQFRAAKIHFGLVNYF